MWADSDTVGLLGKHPTDAPGPDYVEAEGWSWSSRGVNSPRIPLCGGGQSTHIEGECQLRRGCGGGGEEGAMGARAAVGTRDRGW